MQRMKLHLSGVKLHPLGSLHDRVIRGYLTKESQLEVAKRRMEMLRTVHTPQITDAGTFREWSGTVKEAWNSYIGLEYNIEIPEHNKDEQVMLDYYQQVVKHTTPKTQITENGPVVYGLGVLSK